MNQKISPTPELSIAKIKTKIGGKIKVGVNVVSLECFVLQYSITKLIINNIIDNKVINITIVIIFSSDGVSSRFLKAVFRAIFSIIYFQI